MTNEDIKNIKWFMDRNPAPVYVMDSLNKAIKALESQPSDAVNCAYTTEEIAKSFIEDVETVKDLLDGQPSEDCVKREDVKSGMIKYGFLAPDMTVTEFVEDLPSVTPQPKDNSYELWKESYEVLQKRMDRLTLCDDAVSREAVKKMIKELSEYHTGDAFNSDRVITNVERLPSVQLQPKKGKWIEVDIRNCHATLKCSVCDRVIYPSFTFGEYSYKDINDFYPYCHCGAKMEVEE